MNDRRAPFRYECSRSGWAVAVGASDGCQPPVYMCPPCKCVGICCGVDLILTATRWVPNGEGGNGGGNGAMPGLLDMAEVRK